MRRVKRVIEVLVCAMAYSPGSKEFDEHVASAASLLALKGSSYWEAATDCFCGYTDVRVGACEACQAPRRTDMLCPCGVLYKKEV
jgi:hypothetical protein